MKKRINCSKSFVLCCAGQQQQQQGVVTLTQQQVEQLVAQGVVIQPISGQVQYQLADQTSEV